MNRKITIGYQHRAGVNGDLPTAPKLVLANHYLKKLSGFTTGNKAMVKYLPDQIIITKLTS